MARTVNSGPSYLFALSRQIIDRGRIAEGDWPEIRRYYRYMYYQNSDFDMTLVLGHTSLATTCSLSSRISVGHVLRSSLRIGT